MQFYCGKFDGLYARYSMEVGVTYSKWYALRTVWMQVSACYLLVLNSVFLSSCVSHNFKGWVYLLVHSYGTSFLLECKTQ